jgi:Ring finger domain
MDLTSIYRIIVGVKYCFRYNARNRAIRNGEEVDPINLENLPTRPHRRRREKKLMTMDEVNERFPLTKYKNWVASRAREGLPTTGGVTASASRPGSIRNVDAAMPSSPTGTKHSVNTSNTRPGTAASDGAAAEITISPATNALGGDFKGPSATEKAVASPTVEEHNRLEEVQTTASTVDKHPTIANENDQSDDEDDHIHTAVPPELLTNPGDSCAICIDTLEEDDDIRGLTCGHAFHAGCLDPWLTSRRACCPLCKADYYVPKPRPEGEVADTDRTGRRRDARTNMPQSPASAWTGIRGSPRLVLPGRFGGGPMYPGDQYGYDGRRARRARRQAAAAEASGAAQQTPAATANAEATAPRRWVPRISNPFSNMSRPTMPSIHLPGRGRQAEETPAVGAEATTTPSQLEAGVVR